jgi:RNA polymerase sigma-70 factor (ECF subfamily)
MHALFRFGTIAGLSDGELLERFTARRGEGAELAFAALVERHGPTVLRVCRGVLRDTHDAEDAFQATFLVLASKAGAIRRRESVGSWLYGVALRVACDARIVANRRRAHERSAAKLRPEPIRNGDGDDLGQVVLEELGRLPERYRAAVVLCYLEGRTCEEAARRLGWPVGTVKTRLARARGHLRVRLTRRGVVPSVGLLTAASSLKTHGATVPVRLAEVTVRAAIPHAVLQATSAGVVSASAIKLADGVLMSMVATKLKLATIAFLAACIIAGEGRRPRPAGLGAEAGCPGGRDDRTGGQQTSRGLSSRHHAPRASDSCYSAA